MPCAGFASSFWCGCILITGWLFLMRVHTGLVRLEPMFGYLKSSLVVCRMLAWPYWRFRLVQFRPILFCWLETFIPTGSVLVNFVLLAWSICCFGWLHPWTFFWNALFANVVELETFIAFVCCILFGMLSLQTLLAFFANVVDLSRLCTLWSRKLCTLFCFFTLRVLHTFIALLTRPYDALFGFLEMLSCRLVLWNCCVCLGLALAFHFFVGCAFVCIDDGMLFFSFWLYSFV